MLAFFRDQVLGPMLQRRHGLPQRGVRKLEAAGIAEPLVATIAVHDRQGAMDALISAMELYLELRADLPPARPTAGMPELLLDYCSGSGTA